MSIVSNSRMPLAADGNEQMDPFFAQGPASIPPVQRVKRALPVLEEEDRHVDGQDSENEEDENDQGQTANYGKHANSARGKPRQSNATTEGELSDEEERDYGNNGYDEAQGDDSENEVPTPQLSKRSRQSVTTNPEASHIADDDDQSDDDEAGGTQTMDLEGSTYQQILFECKLDLILS